MLWSKHRGADAELLPDKFILDFSSGARLLGSQWGPQSSSPWRSFRSQLKHGTCPRQEDHIRLNSEGGEDRGEFRQNITANGGRLNSPRSCATTVVISHKFQSCQLTSPFSNHLMSLVFAELSLDWTCSSIIELASSKILPLGDSYLCLTCRFVVHGFTGASSAQLISLWISTPNLPMGQLQHVLSRREEATSRQTREVGRLFLSRGAGWLAKIRTLQLATQRGGHDAPFGTGSVAACDKVKHKVERPLP